MKYWLLGVFWLMMGSLFAQLHTVEALVVDGADQPLAGVWVSSDRNSLQAVTDNKGRVTLSELPSDSLLIAFRLMGHQTITKWWHPNLAGAWNSPITLQADYFLMNQVTVTGARREVAATEAPVLTSKISARTLQQVNAAQVADGLALAPGLRIENNCQNCGFTQVRMNGLPGPYSQILINGRPVFSALAGVYGLEQLPAQMVERIEIVRGGGSVLYGGNAIAGTVNVITKTPQTNNFGLQVSQSFTNFEASDRHVQFMGSLINESGTQGAQLFVFDRTRDFWDANKDGFSEITALNSTSMGLEGFAQWNKRSRLTYNLYRIQEFRRGGSDFDRPPHQAQIAEQLDHNIFGGQIQNHWSSKNFKHQITLYTALQTVRRKSYYGAGGRILTPQDSITADDLLALNAYGNTRDFSQNTGIQWQYKAHNRFEWVAGTELHSNWLRDDVPGYNRSITQETHAWGTFLELSFKPRTWMEWVAGARWESIAITGNYAVQNNVVPNNLRIHVPIPRMQALVHLHPNWRLRAGWAAGYRAPQAFDEDLHIETVGGDVRFVLMAPDLAPETSNSFNASLNWDVMKMEGQWHAVVEAFHTQLQNPFITSNPVPMENGGVLLTKRNGSGAAVSGIHIEAGYAHKRTWTINGGFTTQQALYDQPEVIWEAENGGANIATRVLLRTPNHYGFLNFSATPDLHWTFVVSSVFTGVMTVPHVIDPASNFTAIKSTPAFTDLHLKVSYKFLPIKTGNWEIFCGLHNALNSFQRDFDTGPNRDAGYVYGPVRPRTIYFGASWGWK